MSSLECVSEQTLEAYLFGELPERIALSVSEHLAACPECEACATRLEAAGEATVAALRRAFRPSHADTVTGWQGDRVTEGAITVSPCHPVTVSQRVAGYEILEELGRGGMGVVYKAWQAHPARLVALKMLRGGTAAEAEGQVRILAEGDALARLTHPNIIQIFEMGRHKGRPFLALEFVAGGNLGQRLGGRPVSPAPAAVLVERLARAVAHAHQQGIVHRDLKPSNVLLAFEDQAVPAEGEPGSWLLSAVPKITDFGLAKHEALDLTATGALVGTPAYMAPEQAAGHNRAVGPATDIYALGVILYELLTGRPPFQGADVMPTLRQIAEQEPVPPVRLQPAVPRDLSLICLKCLHKEPTRRYADAGQLADELRRWRQGEPLRHTRPVGTLERTWRWCRRNPTVALLLTAFFLVLGAGLVGTTLLWLRARDNFHKSETNLEQAEENFRATFAAVDRYFTTISQDRLLDEPGMTALRKELLRASQPFFEQFVARKKNDPKMRVEHARAISRLADIETQAGSPERALPLWEQGLGLLDALGREQPEDLHLAYEAANCLFSGGECYRRLGRIKEAEPLLEEASRRFQQLSSRKLTDGTLDGEINAWQSLAEVAHLRGDSSRAIERFEQALAATRRIVQRSPKDLTNQCRLARAHLLLGRSLGSRDLRAGLVELEAARTIYEPISRRACRQQVTARAGLATTLGLIGDTQAQLSSPDQAEKVLLQADDLWERLTRDYPEVPDYRYNRSVNQHNLALRYMGWQRPAEAARLCERLVEERERLTREEPMSALYALELGKSYRQLAQIALRGKQDEEAVRWLGKTVEVLLGLVQRDPAQTEARELLARVAGGRAQILARQGKQAEALPSWDLAVTHAPGALRALLLGSRAQTHARCGSWQLAEQDAEAVLKLEPANGDRAYQAATALSLASAVVAGTTSLAENKRQERAEQLAGRAVSLLSRLHRAGYFKDPQALQDLQRDTAFDPLRERADFQALLPK
jgi:serine/threonine protein kinase